VDGVRIVARTLALAALVVTLWAAVYMARPWGDNYAYQTPADYASFMGVLGWAASPYLFFLAALRSDKAQKRFAVIRLAAALVVCGAGLLVVLRSAMVAPDAQGGLMFLFLPLYQWLAIGLAFGIARVLRAMFGCGGS